MEVQLNPVEERVLGCLIEKEMATPEYYPLTLNALTNACNQKNNRNPVMALDSETITRTIYELRVEHRLAVEVSSSGSRTLKYRHCFHDHWTFSPAQMAIICELLIRGPQTPGDLRAHASRLHPFADAAEVEETLHDLGTCESGPVVIQLEKEPGKRERRWAHLFAPLPAIGESPQEPSLPGNTVEPTREDRIQTLEKEIAALRQELCDLKQQFEQFKTAFE
ncbi:DUF480 domain-containing protein [Verrucomicrobia bacterium S94]|nr:DUF480 domain-containing protein [Verrucomicrobia bacterium S94]